MILTDRREVGTIDASPLDDGRTRYRTTVPNGGLLYDVSDSDLRDCYFVTDLYVEGSDVGAAFEVCLLSTATDAMHPRTYLVDYAESPGANVFFLFPPGIEGRMHFSVDDVCDGGGLPFPNPVGFRFHNPTNRIETDAVDYVQIRPVGYEREVTWRQTSPEVTGRDPGRLESREAATRPLLDRYGKLETVDGWRPADEEALARNLRAAARGPAGPDPDRDRSSWGGSAHVRFEGTGFFDTRHDGDRWWFVDPDGYPFWSVGLNNVRPSVSSHFDDEGLVALPDEPSEVLDRGEDLDEIDNLAWNFVRAFGDDHWRDRWVETASETVRNLGFNTLGTWIDDEVRREVGMPYVRILDVAFEDTPVLFDRAGTVFPDVYHDGLAADAEAVARQLTETEDDPALLGYYLGNYPTLSLFPPAELLLTTTGASKSRAAFVEYLSEKYGTDGRLSRAWGEDVSFDDVRDGGWDEIPSGARDDVAHFSGTMVERLFGTLSEACRVVDDNHLNLGPRLNMYLPRWLLRCARHLDVFSPYGYFQSITASKLEAVYDVIQTPILVSEWSVGATDAETPFAGYCRTPDQRERAKAYRQYVEEAAARPWCIGAHYFSLYDQPALGREDGEAFNTGLFDVCHVPYREMTAATRASYDRIYRVAAGDRDPVNPDVEYLAKARSNV